MRPDSLCARVLKGKYYPNSDFLSATKKKRSSETWRAILYGRDVLTRGMIKRIGPGETSIWYDNWIPGLRSLRPLVRMPEATADRVCDLFIPGTRVWDEEIVRKSFMVLEAEEVLKIKPGERLNNDVPAWAFEKNGVYSARSAYSLLKEEQMETAMADTREAMASSDDRAWSQVWKLNVPPKVRVFWWRVLHNSLPSKAELKRRHIEKESFCEMYGDPDESVYHVAFLCPVAKRFWAEVKRLSGVSVPSLHPCSWATDVFCANRCPTAAVATVVCGVWTLWTGRNARRHGRKVWEPGAAARYISTLLENLAMLKTTAKPGHVVVRARWQLPEEGWVKVNIDAAFDSAGVVIRDHSGQVLAGAARWFDCLPDALTAEAMSAREGLELAIENGYDKVILEVDCSNLKALLEDQGGVRSAIGGLCFDISELSREFRDFKIFWCSRGANSVAHRCAQMVSATERSVFWLDYFPVWLLELAAEDCKPAVN